MLSYRPFVSPIEGRFKVFFCLLGSRGTCHFFCQILWRRHIKVCLKYVRSPFSIGPTVVVYVRDHHYYRSLKKLCSAHYTDIHRRIHRSSSYKIIYMVLELLFGHYGIAFFTNDSVKWGIATLINNQSKE